MKPLLILVLLASAAGAYAQDLKENTSATIKIGPLVDATDASAETALTISQADVRLSKNGGDMAQKNDTNACTHDESGMYDCALDATDTSTPGRLNVTVAEAGTLVWSHTYMVVDSAFYDALDGTAPLAVPGDQMTLEDGAITSAKYDGSTAIAQSGDSYARLGAPAGASVSADISAVKSDSAAILIDTGTTLDGKVDELIAEALGTFLNCEVNTANFAGDASNLACILTDIDGGAVTQATGDLTGLQIVVTSGAQIREARFINDTTWDGANSELQLQLSRALPGTLADAVTVVIR